MSEIPRRDTSRRSISRRFRNFLRIVWIPRTRKRHFQIGSRAHSFFFARRVQARAAKKKRRGDSRRATGRCAAISHLIVFFVRGFKAAIHRRISSRLPRASCVRGHTHTRASEREKSMSARNGRPFLSPFIPSVSLWGPLCCAIQS